MKLKILTAPGCSKCENTKRMLRSLVERQQSAFPGLSYEIVDVTEHPEVALEYGLLSTPGVVIEGKLEFTGRPPSEKELTAKLREHAANRRIPR